MLTYAGSRSPLFIERWSNVKNSKVDENFAREIMQLFTIGLDMLNPDGSLMMNEGKPIPTYDSSDIQTYARAW